VGFEAHHVLPPIEPLAGGMPADGILDVFSLELELRSQIRRLARKPRIDGMDHHGIEVLEGALVLLHQSTELLRIAALVRGPDELVDLFREPRQDLEDTARLGVGLRVRRVGFHDLARERLHENHEVFCVSQSGEEEEAIRVHRLVEGFYERRKPASSLLRKGDLSRKELVESLIDERLALELATELFFGLLAVSGSGIARQELDR